MNDIKHDIKKRHKNLSEFRYIAVGFFSDNIIRGYNAEPSVFFKRRTMDQFSGLTFYGNKRNLCDRSCCV